MKEEKKKQRTHNANRIIARHTMHTRPHRTWIVGHMQFNVSRFIIVIIGHPNELHINFRDDNHLVAADNNNNNDSNGNETASVSKHNVCLSFNSGFRRFRSSIFSFWSQCVGPSRSFVIQLSPGQRKMCFIASINLIIVWMSLSDHFMFLVVQCVHS